MADASELRRNIAKLSNEELERMVTIDAGDYVPDALAIAREELEARGIALAPLSDEPDRDGPGEAAGAESEVDAAAEDGEALPPSALACPFCNGPVRRAALFGDNEIIVLFRDNDEQRYVDVLVCRRCGEARLVVDFEANVTEG
jgi:uncharacterized protein YbaR (Trm112 family)